MVPSVCMASVYMYYTACVCVRSLEHGRYCTVVSAISRYCTVVRVIAVSAQTGARIRALSSKHFHPIAALKQIRVERLNTSRSAGVVGSLLQDHVAMS